MLFTGSGRHRRKTQAEKAIAVAGVAGVGLAMPLLAATGAHAASVSTWDKVAECESGGDWSINTGNGFYGGLQFTSSTWKAYGGGQYANQADRASKGQQIAVAEKVLASQGPGAWPVCSANAALGNGGSAADVDTGSSKSGSSSSSYSTRGAEKQSSQDASPATAAPSFPGKAGYDAASGKYWYEKNGGWYWTSHQSIYKQFAGGAAQQAPASQAQTPAQAPQSASGGYTVRDGDTLSGIAQAQGVSGGWQHLYDANRSTIGGNADLIMPGQVLKLG
ncbi:transglycosylase family protein [Kitasatospora sp. GP82]|uniref:LysM peptidoglycan-binding domain-containing protein n=1 Tax=Kitasatospora sp. GP82 TaxID=3035089 RepID=UPI0024738795|nr:transglycosylase family protein [Kitasatospora sp. GP82]MDH6123094.1 LysM repeat protein [Kitasatospora sp. GP82]